MKRHQKFVTPFTNWSSRPGSRRYANVPVRLGGMFAKPIAGPMVTCAFVSNFRIRYENVCLGISPQAVKSDNAACTYCSFTFIVESADACHVGVGIPTPDGVHKRFQLSKPIRIETRQRFFYCAR